MDTEDYSITITTTTDGTAGRLIGGNTITSTNDSLAGGHYTVFDPISVLQNKVEELEKRLLDLENKYCELLLLGKEGETPSK